MAEEVETGGIKKFVYDKTYSPKLSDEKKKEIELEYFEAEERKRREKRTKKFIIAGIILALIIIGLLIFL